MLVLALESVLIAVIVVMRGFDGVFLVEEMCEFHLLMLGKDNPITSLRSSY